MFTITPNLSCAPGLTWALFNTKEALKVAGWTVPASSDGVTYSAGGDTITSGARFGAAVFTTGSLSSANAWMRLRHPLGSCELLFQHGAANGNDQWKIRYSRLGFTGGTPSATVAPTAADEVYILGSSSTFTEILGNVVTHLATLRIHILVGDADEDYSWMVVGTEIGRTTEQFVWVFDRVSDLEDPGDDPTVVGFAPTSSANAWLNPDTWTPQTSASSMCFWTFLSTWSTRQQQMRCAAIGNIPSVVFSNSDGVHNYGANPYSRKIDLWLPDMWWFHRSIGSAIPVNVTPVTRSTLKGKSRLFKGFISTHGVWAGNTVSYINDHYLVIYPSISSTLTALVVPWQAGVRPGW